MDMISKTSHPQTQYVLLTSFQRTRGFGIIGSSSVTLVFAMCVRSYSEQYTCLEFKHLTVDIELILNQSLSSWLPYDMS